MPPLSSSFYLPSPPFPSPVTLPPHSMAAPLLLLPLLLVAGWGPQAALGGGGGAKFGFDLRHRFSDAVRQWADSRSHRLPGGWPDKGTAAYYAALAGHDRAIHGRGLSELTFADGNETLEISSLGYLHYAVVALGTPNVTFLVALDTGSDLFWVPCDCISCAPTASPSYGLQGISFDIYSPSKSSTSKSVPCNSSSCQAKCSGANSSCPYRVDYVSDDTSSSGTLVEDVLYLTTEDTHPKVVKAPIVFGCGQVQTGSFLDSAAPNGLFGLGMDNISVPSTLSSAGLVSNSFSMCFGSDGLGRISFGDKGSSDQEETQFNIYHSQSTYNITLTGVEVGNSSINASFTAVVDSGTSFTYLADPVYSNVVKSFNAQAHDTRYPSDSNIPFDYCYHISSNETVIEIPGLNLTTKGGSQFPINNPVVVISVSRTQYVYCLAIIQSSQLNIIGQNFLTGLRLVFDRERKVLGWKKFNCYDVEDANPLPVNPGNSSAASPTAAIGPSSYSPEATGGNTNGTQVTVLTPGSPGSYSTQLRSPMGLYLALLLLSVAIL